MQHKLVIDCFTFQDYYQSGRMLVRMAEAIGRVVLAGREMTRLAGYVLLYYYYHRAYCNNSPGCRCTAS